MLNVIMIVVTGLITATMMVTPPTHPKEATDLYKYKDEYRRIGMMFDNLPANFNSRLRNTKIYYGNLSGNMAGICYLLSNEIHIDKEIWDFISEENKEELMFHELTYCVMKEMGHRETGIMIDSGLHPSKFYRRFYSNLINDLFKCTKNCISIEYRKGKYNP